MCLNLITKQYNPPDPKVRKAWKYVKRNTYGGLFSIYQRHTYSKEWQIAKNAFITAYNEFNGTRPKYDSGFHVFATREDARKAKRILRSHGYGTFANTENIVLVKVEVKDVHTEGTDATTTELAYLDAKIKTLVASQMRIVEVVKD